MLKKKTNFTKFANLVIPNVSKLEQQNNIKYREIFNFFEQLHLVEEDFVLKSRAAVEKDTFLDDTNLIEINKLDLETEMLHFEQPQHERLQYELSQDYQKNEDEQQQRQPLSKNNFLFDSFIKVEEPDLFDDNEVILKQNLFYNWVSFFDFFFKTKSIILKNFILFNNFKKVKIKRVNKNKHLHKLILNATSRNFYITLLSPERVKIKNFKQKKKNQLLKKTLALKYNINIIVDKINDKKQIKTFPLFSKRNLKIKKRIVLITFSLGLTSFKSKKAKNQPFVLKLLILYIKNYLTIYSKRYFLRNKTEPIFSIILKTPLTNLRIKQILIELLSFSENHNNSSFKF